MRISFSYLFSRLNGVLLRGSLAAITILITALVWGHPAFAQPTDAATMGDMFCNMQTEMEPFGDLFSAIAYIAGVFFVGQGLYMLVRYYDNPASTPLHQPLTRLSGGAALLAAPSVAEALVMTIFGQAGGGGIDVCTPGTVTATSSGDVGLDTLLTNLVGNIEDPLTYLISCVAIVVGLFMIVQGLMKASKYGMDPREHSMTKIVVNLVVGAILIVVGQSFGFLLESVFGTGDVTASTVVTGWTFITELGASQQFITAVEDAGIFIELVGMIAFVRGWMILKSAYEGSGQATMAQGLTHLFGGVLAMNIFSFLQIMDSTFGTGFLG